MCSIGRDGIYDWCGFTGEFHSYFMDFYPFLILLFLYTYVVCIHVLCYFILRMWAAGAFMNGWHISKINKLIPYRHEYFFKTLTLSIQGWKFFPHVLFELWTRNTHQRLNWGVAHAKLPISSTLFYTHPPSHCSLIGNFLKVYSALRWIWRCPDSRPFSNTEVHLVNWDSLFLSVNSLKSVVVTKMETMNATHELLKQR